MEASTSPKRDLLLPAVFGVVFGFLLQRGGMGKYETLMGQLLLTDWAVVKVMLTAIVVGMAGVLSMHSLGMVKLHLKPTKIVANLGGGLLFGVGFAMIGYCPGSAAAALGEGHWDALFGMAGLVVGSYLYAECSGWLDGNLAHWGDFGKLTLPQLFGVPQGPFALGFGLFLTTILLAVGNWLP